MFRKPKKKTEFEIQSCLYQKLMEDGFDVAGGVSFRGNYQNTIFDIVVFSDRRAVAIIEVKKGDLTWSKGQKESYELNGNLPVYLYNQRTDYESFVKRLRKECLP